MKVSYNWICELAQVNWSPEEMSDRLTAAGTECEEITSLAKKFENIVVGRIVSVSDVIGADKLKSAQVDLGDGKYTVLCGAPNIAADQKAPVARVGAILPGGAKVESVTHFGVESHGIILSEAELELSEDHSGIMVLPSASKIGQPLVELLDLNDYMLEFDLTPNRSDSMSAIGIARDVSALAGTTLKRPTIEFPEGKETSDSVIKVEIDSPDFCARYAGRVIRGVKVGPSPQWLRNKLIASGMRPINNVVDITNFVMIETGQPLHAFDLKYFKTGKVVVRRAKDGDKFVTLDEQERSVDSSVLLITNGKDDLAVGGVMGGLKSSITSATKDVLLEAAYFDPGMIRKSRRKLGMVTDASIRFEKGVDPNNTTTASDRATQLLVEIAGGMATKGTVDNYARRIDPRQVTLRPERLNKILGTEITAERISAILRGLEFSVENGDALTVEAPTFRPDVTREIDLIEEVSRIIGYDEIPIAKTWAGSDQSEFIAQSDKLEGQVDQLRVILTGCGYDEILGSGLAEKSVLEAIQPESNWIEVANPVSDEFAVMRNTLIYSLLSAARANITRQVTNVRLFEIGNVYAPHLGGKNLHEIRRLGILVSGSEENQWRTRPAELDFYFIKGALTAILEELRIPEIAIEPRDYPALSSGTSFNLTLNGQSYGVAGQVAERISKRFNIKQRVTVTELDLDKILKLAGPVESFKPLPRYPSSIRDIALVVDESTLVGDITESVRKTGSDLVMAVDIFDLFRGKQIPKGKKSIAISITYLSLERSLESSEVEATEEKIIASLKKDFNAEVRKS